MRGSPVYQVNEVFNIIKGFGESKYKAEEQARKHLGQITVHNIGKELKVYSYATADRYRETWINVLRYAKENYHIKDIEKLTSEHVRYYLQSKILKGVKRRTFQVYASAIEKLEVALNKYAQLNNTGNIYKFDIQDIRKEAHRTLEKVHLVKTYEDPEALINVIANDTYKIIATAQYTSGFKSSEINYITLRNFLDNNIFKVTNAKGGLIREIELPKKTYNDLKVLVANSLNSKFVFSKSSYLNALKRSAIATNQIYTGSDGLRWNFVQNKFIEFQRAGYGYEQTLSKIARLLGNYRADTIVHYLQI